MAMRLSRALPVSDAGRVRQLRGVDQLQPVARLRPEFRPAFTAPGLGLPKFRPSDWRLGRKPWCTFGGSSDRFRWPRSMPPDPTRAARPGALRRLRAERRYPPGAVHRQLHHPPVRSTRPRRSRFWTWSAFRWTARTPRTGIPKAFRQRLTPSTTFLRTPPKFRQARAAGRFRDRSGSAAQKPDPDENIAASRTSGGSLRCSTPLGTTPLSTIMRRCLPPSRRTFRQQSRLSGTSSGARSVPTGVINSHWTSSTIWTSAARRTTTCRTSIPATPTAAGGRDRVGTDPGPGEQRPGHAREQRQPGTARTGPAKRERSTSTPPLARAGRRADDHEFRRQHRPAGERASWRRRSCTTGTSPTTRRTKPARPVPQPVRAAEGARVPDCRSTGRTTLRTPTRSRWTTPTATSLRTTGIPSVMAAAAPRPTAWTTSSATSRPRTSRSRGSATC